MDEFTDFPVVKLPGSEGWNAAYEWGRTLDNVFPNQDADEFAYACEYNNCDPCDTASGIVDFKMVEQGYNDGDSWVWIVTFTEDKYKGKSKWVAIGSCDYTGWDCQSNLEWHQIA